MTSAPAAINCWISLTAAVPSVPSSDKSAVSSVSVSFTHAVGKPNGQADPAAGPNKLVSAAAAANEPPKSPSDVVPFSSPCSISTEHCGSRGANLPVPLASPASSGSGMTFAVSLLCLVAGSFSFSLGICVQLLRVIFCPRMESPSTVVFVLAIAPIQQRRAKQVHQAREVRILTGSLSSGSQSTAVVSLTVRCQEEKLL